MVVGCDCHLIILFITVCMAVSGKKKEIFRQLSFNFSGLRSAPLNDAAIRCLLVVMAPFLSQ